MNSTIPVILSPKLCLYDLQKPRYAFAFFAISRSTKSAIFCPTWNFTTDFFGFSMIELTYNYRRCGRNFSLGDLGPYKRPKIHKISRKWQIASSSILPIDVPYVNFRCSVRPVRAICSVRFRTYPYVGQSVRFYDTMCGFIFLLIC